MKYLVTHILDEKERQNYKKMGLFCYDLRSCDFGGEIASIEKRVLVNRVGSMVTNKEIKLGDTFTNNFVDYDDFISINTSVDSIDELLSKTKNKGKER